MTAEKRVVVGTAPPGDRFSGPVRDAMVEKLKIMDMPLCPHLNTSDTFVRQCLPPSDQRRWWNFHTSRSQRCWHLDCGLQLSFKHEKLQDESHVVEMVVHRVLLSCFRDDHIRPNAMDKHWLAAVGATDPIKQRDLRIASQQWLAAARERREGRPSDAATT